MKKIKIIAVTGLFIEAFCIGYACTPKHATDAVDRIILANANEIKNRPLTFCRQEGSFDLFHDPSASCPGKGTVLVAARHTAAIAEKFYHKKVQYVNWRIVFTHEFFMCGPITAIGCTDRRDHTMVVYYNPEKNDVSGDVGKTIAHEIAHGVERLLHIDDYDHDNKAFWTAVEDLND